MCYAFAGLGNELYKMHSTYIKKGLASCLSQNNGT